MKKILVVDDVMFNIKLVHEAMDSLGYQTIEAHDGKQGIEVAEKESPDLILMDIQMPKVNGIEAMKRIKEISLLSNVPIIAYTAFAMRGDKERLLSEGFDAYLAKPVTVANIVDIVNKFLS